MCQLPKTHSTAWFFPVRTLWPWEPEEKLSAFGLTSHQVEALPGSCQPRSCSFVSRQSLAGAGFAMVGRCPTGMFGKGKGVARGDFPLGSFCALGTGGPTTGLAGGMTGRRLLPPSGERREK